MAGSSVVLPSESVRDLKHILRADAEWWQEQLPAASEIDADYFRECLDESASLLAALECDDAECEIKTDWPNFLRTIISGRLEDAHVMLTEPDRGTPLERREAIRWLRVAATVFERMEGTEGVA